VSDTVATQSRSASFVASFSVRVPDSTVRTSAPSSFMRYTLSCCRRTSSAPMYTTHSMPNSAHAVAVATPCWPAPVSAMMRCLPMRRASRIWPSVLLILWDAGVRQVLPLQVDRDAARRLAQPAAR
jgi:hypothetical protein